MTYPLDEIRKAMEKKDYKFFDNNLKFNANIISIRNDNKVPDSFDDSLYLIYRDDNLKFQVKSYQVTTDPGLATLLKPVNVKGTAILAPGQYRSSHTIRKHQGKYEAVCQKNPVTVWRDNNRDKTLDFDNEVKETGIFGINIHRSNPNTESTIVGKWSAGCTVFKRVKDFYEFMQVCYKSRELYGNSFTYTLLTVADFNGSSSSEIPEAMTAKTDAGKSDKEKAGEKEIAELNAQLMELIDLVKDKSITDFMLRERDGLKETVDMLIRDLKKLPDSAEKTELIGELKKEEEKLKKALSWYKQMLTSKAKLPSVDKILNYLQKQNNARHNRLSVLNKKIAKLAVNQ